MEKLRILIVMRVMKKRQAQVARVLFYLVVLAAAQSCTTPQSRVSEKSWSQTVVKEDREQERIASPEDGWTESR